MAIVLSGCQSINKFPAKYIYEVNIKDQTCGQYVITDYESIRYAWDKDLPWESCPITFGLSYTDAPEVLVWARDLQRYAKESCD